MFHYLTTRLTIGVHCYVYSIELNNTVHYCTHSVGFSISQAAPDGGIPYRPERGMQGKSRAPSERTRSLAAGLSIAGMIRHGWRIKVEPTHGCGVSTGAGPFDCLARSQETAR